MLDKLALKRFEDEKWLELQMHALSLDRMTLEHRETELEHRRTKLREDATKRLQRLLATTNHSAEQQALLLLIGDAEVEAHRRNEAWTTAQGIVDGLQNAMWKYRKALSEDATSLRFISDGVQHEVTPSAQNGGWEGLVAAAEIQLSAACDHLEMCESEFKTAQQRHLDLLRQLQEAVHDGTPEPDPPSTN